MTIIENGRVQDDQVNVNLDARTLFAGVGVLAGRRRYGIGDGNLGSDGRREDNRAKDQEREIAQRRKETPEELSGWGRNTRSWNRR
jgi:hypothetical protein